MPPNREKRLGPSPSNADLLTGLAAPEEVRSEPVGYERSSTGRHPHCSLSELGHSPHQMAQFALVQLARVDSHAGEVACQFQGEGAVQAGPEEQGAAQRGR